MDLFLLCAASISVLGLLSFITYAYKLKKKKKKKKASPGNILFYQQVKTNRKADIKKKKKKTKLFKCMLRSVNL